VRGVSAFRPLDQTHGTIENSALTAPSGSTVVATGRGMGPATLPVNSNDLDTPVHDRPESSNDNSIQPSTPV